MSLKKHKGRCFILISENIIHFDKKYFQKNMNRYAMHMCIHTLNSTYDLRGSNFNIAKW